MTTKKILLGLILLSAVFALSAESKFAPSSIGLNYGTSTGSGYAMRWIGDKIGWQTTLALYTWGSDNVFFYANEYDSSGESQIKLSQTGHRFYGSLGISGIIPLDRFNGGMFYLIAGGAYQYSSKNKITATYQKYLDPAYTDTYYLVSGSEVKTNVVEHRWVTGLGPGIELSPIKHLHFSFELPLTINQKSEVVMYIPQVGIHYYF